ncbi:MAG: hypothetical protein IKO53_07495 [Lachnospiraceae bacterium]|nr:hypothetical protein [Lachnospiraceae bacterium]
MEKRERLHDFIKSCYRIDKVRLMVALTVLVVMATASFASFDAGFANSYDSDIEDQINSTLIENIGSYAGIFSVTVTASVNPTGTLAIISLIGVIEKSDQYFPNAKWLEGPQHFLCATPIIRTAANLPISTPAVTIILTIVTIALYVVRSTSVSKALSAPTIDKIEEFSGYIVTVALSFMPVAMVRTVQAADIGDTTQKVVSVGTYAALLFLSLVSAIFNLIVYIVIHNCLDAVELLAAAIPIKGMNVVVEILKAILHLTLVVLQIVSPFLCVILGIIFFIISLILFRWLSVLSVYYTHVYVKPVLRKVFRSHEVSPFMHKKFPKRGRKKYPELTMAIPAFSMNRRARLVKKRELIWLSERAGEPVFLKIKPLRRIKEISMEEMNPLHREVYLQKTLRFTRIVSEDHTVEIIFSSEYNDRWEVLLERFGLKDYRVVQDRLANEEKVTFKNWWEKLKRKMFKPKDNIVGTV